MLNELCQLADALEKAEITPKEWFPQLKPLPKVTKKKPCYRIAINEDGSIHSIDTIDEQLVVNLLKWEPNLGNSFPGMNLQSLYLLTKQEQLKKIEEWHNGKTPVDIGILKTWCAEGENKWDLIEPRKASCFSNKLSKCLGEIPAKVLMLIQSEGDTEAKRNFEKLISRVSRYLPNPIRGKSIAVDKYNLSFREVLEKFIWESLINQGAAKTLLPILVSDKKPSDPQSNISIYLDIPDYDDWPISSEEATNFLNLTFLNSKSFEHQSEKCSVDAFGNELVDWKKTLPDVSLSYLGKVGLRSMNHESPCQYRYGTIDAVSFPIGFASRKRAKGALEWLRNKSLEGKTWGRADGNELIFAYPSILPKVPISLASVFGAQKIDDSEVKFFKLAESVISSLKGIAKDLNCLQLNVFSLKKMDKSSKKTKVVFYRNYSAQRLTTAAMDWQDGCTNVPEVDIFMLEKKEDTPQKADLQVPFPLDIAKIANSSWKYDGVKKQLISDSIPIFQPASGIELLLEENIRTLPMVRIMLNRFIDNSKQLLLHLGEAGTRKKVLVLSSNSENSYKLWIPAFIGLLLNKIGIRKEIYMSKAAFLTGRMLKLADELHALYCEIVRKKDFPPQLVGNALFVSALDNPIQAKAVLGRRLSPYIAWAKQFRNKEEEKSWRAGWLLKLFEETATDLDKTENLERCTDTDRAEMFIGYLASFPKKADEPKETTEVVTK